jgi:hypothetical protein
LESLLSGGVIISGTEPDADLFPPTLSRPLEPSRQHGVQDVVTSDEVVEERGRSVQADEDQQQNRNEVMQRYQPFRQHPVRAEHDRKITQEVEVYEMTAGIRV